MNASFCVLRDKIKDEYRTCLGENNISCYLECIDFGQTLLVSDAVEVALCRARIHYHSSIMMRPALVWKKCFSYAMGQLDQGVKTRLLT